jgi:hypothetical protein
LLFGLVLTDASYGSAQPTILVGGGVDRSHLFFTFLTDEEFAAGVEEDDRCVEEFGLCGGEVGLVAEVEAVGAGEEGDREGGDRGEVETVGFHGSSPVDLSGFWTSTLL